MGKPTTASCRLLIELTPEMVRAIDRIAMNQFTVNSKVVVAIDAKQLDQVRTVAVDEGMPAATRLMRKFQREARRKLISPPSRTSVVLGLIQQIVQADN